MAVCIRLVRLGRRNRPFYRVRVADSRAVPTGRFIEEVGMVDPIERDDQKQVVLKKERIEYWLAQGARVSPTVASILKKHGVARPRVGRAGKREEASV